MNISYKCFFHSGHLITVDGHRSWVVIEILLHVSRVSELRLSVLPFKVTNEEVSGITCRASLIFLWEGVLLTFDNFPLWQLDICPTGQTQQNGPKMSSCTGGRCYSGKLANVDKTPSLFCLLCILYGRFNCNKITYY